MKGNGTKRSKWVMWKLMGGGKSEVEEGGVWRWTEVDEEGRTKWSRKGG